MSVPIFLQLYSNGNLYVSNHIGFTPGGGGEGSSSATRTTEAGTLVKVWEINSDAAAQKITTLTGSGNASASALAATGGSTAKDRRLLTEIT